MKSAIVGCGGISRVHAQVLSDADYTELVACADIRPERARERADKFGGRPYTDYLEMLDLEKPDVLHICTPHSLHVPMALEALRRGVNVFMEKPAAISDEQFDQLLAAARESSAKVGVCFQNRFNPTTKAMRRLLAEGDSGQALGARAFVTWKREAPYYTESGWRGSLETEGGSALINQSIHTMDLLVHLLGTPVSVEATASNRHLVGVIETEDTLEACITFEGGARALFYATTAYAEDAPVLVEIVCEGRTIRFEGDELTVRGKDGSRRVETLQNVAAIGKSYWGSGHSACIGSFYASLRGEEEYPIGVEAVEKTMRLVFATYRSAREGRAIAL